MPIRWNLTNTPSINVPENYAINRTFDFGNLATLFMLEDRVTKRTQAGQDSNEFDPTELTDPSDSAEPIVGSSAPADWNSSVDAAMLQLQQQLNVKRTNKSDLMLGPSQIAWIQSETERSVAAGMTWQLYSEGTVMQDWFAPDYEGALLTAMAPNDAVQQYWQEVYDNLTSTPAAGAPNNTYETYATTPSSLSKYGKTQNVTDDVLTSSRVEVALGRYNINNDFDSWQGYLWDRYYFLGNISKANNPSVYSGDSHDFWTGYLTYVNPEEYVTNGSSVPTSPIVATEFDGGSVSSDGGSGVSTWPLDYSNAAWLAANPNMVHVEQRYKGFVYVQLTPTNQHVENIHVSTIASMDYVGFCGAAFDVPARVNGSGEIVINPGKCGAVPGARTPYGSAGVLVTPTYSVSSVKPTTIQAGTAMPTDSFLTAE